MMGIFSFGGNGGGSVDPDAAPSRALRDFRRLRNCDSFWTGLPLDLVSLSLEGEGVADILRYFVVTGMAGEYET